MKRHRVFRRGLAATSAAALAGGVLLAAPVVAQPTSGAPQHNSQVASPLRAKARKPLCRKGFVPVKRKSGNHKPGYRCARLDRPKVNSSAQYVRAVTADVPKVPGGHHSKKELKALRRAYRMTVDAMVAGVKRVRSLPPDASAPATARAATGPTATFESRVCNNGTCSETRGTMKAPGGGRVGFIEEVEIKTGEIEDQVWQTYRMVVVLNPCPNARGQVTGHVTLGYEAFFWDKDLFKQVLKATTSAAVTAPVDSDARVQPYDLKGTAQYEVTKGNAQKTSTERMGFLDLNRGPRSPGLTGFSWGGPPEKQWFFDYVNRALSLMEYELDSRLLRIEAEWREQKQCLNVITTPADLGTMAPGAQQSIIVQAQAVDDGKDIKAKLRASITGGTITPAEGTTRLGAPGQFTFTMGPGDTAQITFTAISNRGIGERILKIGTAQTAPLPQTLQGTVIYDHKKDRDSYHEHSRSVINVTLALDPESTFGVANYRATGGTWEGSYEDWDSGIHCSHSGSGSGTGVTGSLDYDWSGGHILNMKGGYTMDLAGIGGFQVSGSCEGYPEPIETYGVSFGLSDLDQVSPIQHLTGSRTTTEGGATTVLTWDLTGS